MRWLKNVRLDLKLIMPLIYHFFFFEIILHLSYVFLLFWSKRYVITFSKSVLKARHLIPLDHINLLLLGVHSRSICWKKLIVFTIVVRQFFNVSSIVIMPSMQGATVCLCNVRSFNKSFNNSVHFCCPGKKRWVNEQT